jgi:hypothetical protein
MECAFNRCAPRRRLVTPTHPTAPPRSGAASASSAPNGCGARCSRAGPRTRRSGRCGRASRTRLRPGEFAWRALVGAHRGALVCVRDSRAFGASRSILFARGAQVQCAVQRAVQCAKGTRGLLSSCRGALAPRLTRTNPLDHLRQAAGRRPAGPPQRRARRRRGPHVSGALCHLERGVKGEVRPMQEPACSPGCDMSSRGAAAGAPRVPTCPRSTPLHPQGPAGVRLIPKGHWFWPRSRARRARRHCRRRPRPFHCHGAGAPAARGPRRGGGRRRARHVARNNQLCGADSRRGAARARSEARAFGHARAAAGSAA